MLAETFFSGVWAICGSGGICARILSRGLACPRARCSTWIFAWTDVRLAFHMMSWSVQSFYVWFFEAGNSQLFGLRCHSLNGSSWRRLDSFPYRAAGSAFASHGFAHIHKRIVRSIAFRCLLVMHMVWVGLHTRETSHIFAQPHVRSIEFACMCVCVLGPARANK